MNDALVKVRRVGVAWMVDGAEGLEPLLFLSGAKAEAQAHALARSIAHVGGGARVAVHDRAQQLVGTARYVAAKGRLACERRRAEEAREARVP